MSFWKERKRGREALIFLEKPQVILTRMLLEMRTEKAALIRSQMEMKSVRLETEATADLLPQRQRLWLNRACRAYGTWNFHCEAGEQ